MSSYLRDTTLVIDAPAGSANMLALDNAGTSSGLDVSDAIFIGLNGSLRNEGSLISAGALVVNNQATCAGESLSQFANTYVASPNGAQLVLSNGWISTSQRLSVGVDSYSLGEPGRSGVFTQFGGTNEVGLLLIGSGGVYNLRDGQTRVTNGLGLNVITVSNSMLPPRLNVSGGTLSAPRIYLSQGSSSSLVLLTGGSMAAQSAEIWGGVFTQTGGTNFVGSFTVVGGSYALAGGRLITGQAAIVAGKFTQSGGAYTNTNTVSVTGQFTQYELNGGILDSPFETIQQARLWQWTGATNHAGLLKIYNGGWVNLVGGELSTSNTILGDIDWPGGRMDQDGGTHRVRLLTVGGDGVYWLKGGTLSAETIRLTGEFRLVNGVLDNNQSTVFANGSLWAQRSAQLGPVTLANTGASKIYFQNDAPATIEFQDSSAVAWDPASSLEIWSWSGATHHLYVGFNAQALTTSQLRQIVFRAPAGFPGGVCPSRILSSGEVVPAFAPVLGYSTSGGRLVLNWAEGYQLYSATNLSGPYEFHASTSPFTNLFDSPQRFFRLRQP